MTTRIIGSRPGSGATDSARPAPFTRSRSAPWLALLAAVAMAFVAPAASAAATLKVAIDTPGSLIIPDSTAGVMRRSDGGATLPIYFNAPGTTAPSARMYFIPTDATTLSGTPRSDIDFRFRVEDIPLSCQGSTAWVPDSVWVNGGSNPNVYAIGTAHKLGTGEGDFIEFTYRLPNHPLGWLGGGMYVDLVFGSDTYPCNWWSRLALEFINPVAIVGGYIPPGVDPSAIDRYFRLLHYKWPDTFVDNAALPEYISLESAPIGGESIEIGGTGLIYAPTSASTDGNGVFGVVAFVDPASFDKSAPGKADTPTSGSLTLTYKQVMQTHQITGNFAEVIQAEGRITIVDSSGTVKVGDFLKPGTKLSLSARIGEPPAQLGLRFVNGSDASVVQDVYTNACITDLIVIGQTEFTNKSVIQGKTPLMSMTRWLCEQAAGLPNTPEEWAKATGKLTVKLAVSSLVPVSMGYEMSAFVVKYAVGDVTGRIYDYTMSSPGDNRNKSATKVASADAKSVGLPRLELSTYYDASTRIAESIPGNVGIYLAAADTAFTTSVDGLWQELTGAAAVDRTWAATPDSLDKTGPLLRMSHSYSTATWVTTFRLSASDASGLDAASLGVTIDGIAGSVTSSFEYRGEGVWVGEFIGPPPQSYTVHASLSDRVGNRSTLDWVGTLMPGPPQTLSAFYYGAKTWIEWALPSNMVAADLLYYEVRQNYWTTLGGWMVGPWQSVGTLGATTLDLPAGFSTASPYYVEVRAWNARGMAGTASRSVDITAVETTARLDVARAGAGSGTIAGQAIACGDDCVGFYTLGTSVTLTAIPAAGSTFTGWTGACAGPGTCTVAMNAAASVTATFAVATNPVRLGNISTRGQVLTGDNVMIGGFIIGGSTPKLVLVRARGPSMIPAGVVNAMANPQVTLVDAAQSIIASNDDWGDAANSGAIAATGLAPTNAFESAILVLLNPGAYTAVVSGVGGGTGVGIVEVFEVDQPEMPLTNISTRGRVLAGDDVMIGGFIIQGHTSKTVLIRARGPSMIPAGVTDALANPQVTLVDSAQTIIASNDNWGDATNAAAITATGLAPTNALESAILVTLQPGAYTVVVSGVGGTTGVGIVEVFAQ